MAIRTFKPYTPARRNMTVSAFDGVDKKAKPERSLVETLKKNSGRLANYLGLTPVTCLESDSTGGVYLFESENQEQVRYTIHLEEEVWRLYPTS